jgi:hypothetical protein
MPSILLIFFMVFGVLSYTYILPRHRARKRIRNLERSRKELFANTAEKRTEDTRKTGLNIPGYYEDIVNKDKLRKTYKWELHDSF